MSRHKRRTFTTAFKTKVALEASKERKTLAELASEFDLKPSEILTKAQDLIKRDTHHATRDART